ncbi:MAG: hypothetical protein AMXMBFR84_32750 [Candidatus Hydrogenedentota bacterium]
MVFALAGDSTTTKYFAIVALILTKRYSSLTYIEGWPAQAFPLPLSDGTTFNWNRKFPGVVYSRFGVENAKTPHPASGWGVLPRGNQSRITERTGTCTVPVKTGTQKAPNGKPCPDFP